MCCTARCSTATWHTFGCSTAMYSTAIHIQPGDCSLTRVSTCLTSLQHAPRTHKTDSSRKALTPRMCRAASGHDSDSPRKGADPQDVKQHQHAPAGRRLLLKLREASHRVVGLCERGRELLPLPLSHDVVQGGSEEDDGGGDGEHEDQLADGGEAEDLEVRMELVNI